MDITVKNFPRYPAFYQDKYVARNAINGYPILETDNGFPLFLQYRKVEIRLLNSN